MSASSIRIATYNLQKCVGIDLRRRPERSLQVINALNSEIVVLQEVDKRMSPRPSALPHDMLKSTGWRILSFEAPGNSQGDSLGWHGNAMLIRDTVELIDAQPIELPGLEPRGAIRADLNTAIGPVRIFGHHLGLVKRYRLLQIAAIMRQIRDLPACATILAGDFNDWSRRTDVLEAAMGRLGFIDTPPSFPAPRPVARLDRFALSPDLKAMKTGTYIARPARVASDHLPVWADITRR